MQPYSLSQFHNASLKEYNTFGIDVEAKTLFIIHTEEELRLVLKELEGTECKILGGGSNILCTKDIKQPVIKMAIPGIRIVEESESHIIVEAGSGESWHGFVMWTLAMGYGGLENLSLIPGCVGAAPMQNIGAYGVEQDQNFTFLDAMNLNTGKVRRFTREECRFGYRESIFKKEERGTYAILRVAYRLTKKEHALHLDYGVIRDVLQEKNITNPGIRDISDAVIAIRSSKLPDPAKLGNAGSFFKNPVISTTQFSGLREQYPTMPSFPVSDMEIKVPAGWLIEQCGLKGYRQGDAGIHQHQALVLVNFGNATGTEILQLSAFVQKSVFEKFHIAIEPEVNVW